MKKAFIILMVMVIFIGSCGKEAENRQQPVSSRPKTEAVIESSKKMEKELPDKEVSDSPAEQTAENAKTAENAANNETVNEKSGSEEGTVKKAGKAAADKSALPDNKAAAPDYKKDEKELGKVTENGKKRAGESGKIGNKNQKQAEQDAQKSFDQLEKAEKIELKEIEKEAGEKNKKHDKFDKSKEKSKNAFDELDSEFD